MSVASDRPPPDREADTTYEVTPLELFFDLVFVFGVSQLSHHWLEHMTWRSAAETTVLLLPVLGVMAFGLFMNASLAKAFTSSRWQFVIPLLVIQIGRTVWTIANAPDAM